MQSNQHVPNQTTPVRNTERFPGTANGKNPGLPHHDGLPQQSDSDQIITQVPGRRPARSEVNRMP